MRPRIGHIQFLNCLPLYYGLINNKMLFNVDLVKGIPTELNKKLLENELDVSPISAIEYCRHADKFVLLPELTVSSDGKVKSILLISKLPIEKLKNKTVALTKASATSRILTKIIFKEKYNLDVQYIDNKPNLKDTLNEADAVLLIGDEALKVLYKPNDLFIYDLGVEWKEFTGHKMVYAVWAVRREFMETNFDLLKEIYSGFKSSMEYSSTRLHEVAYASSRWEIYDTEFLFEYFNSLRFEFGKEYQTGMVEFFNYAKKYEYVSEVPELEFAPVDQKINSEYKYKKTPVLQQFVSDIIYSPLAVHKQMVSDVFKSLSIFDPAHSKRYYKAPNKN